MTECCHSRLLAVGDRCPPAMQQRDQWHIKDFALVAPVGHGSVSNVFYALCRKSCLRVAIKAYTKAKLTRLNARQVEREIAIHSSLSHPNIVDFYAAFEDEQGIYLVLEFAERGDLFDAVKRSGGRMPEAALVQQVLYPYLCALMYLHSTGIIHRDIKPENTVFTREHVLKITDFGLAINTRQERPVTRLGTLDYMAPEVLRCPDKQLPDDNKDRTDLVYNEAVDAWAVGVLAAELIVGRPPFGMADRESTMRAISQGLPLIPDWVSSGAASFIALALDKSPATRAPVGRLLQHPWITMHVRGGEARPAAPLALHRARMGPTNRLRGLMEVPRAGSMDLGDGSSAVTTTTSALASNAADIGWGGARCASGSASPLLADLRSARNGVVAGSLNSFGSLGGSLTGSCWDPAGATRTAAAIAAAAAAAAAAATAQLDPRPTKRLLQRCGGNMSDAGTGPVGAFSSPETGSKAAVQAYWTNLGPGWGGNNLNAGTSSLQTIVADCAAPQHAAAAPVNSTGTATSGGSGDCSDGGAPGPRVGSASSARRAAVRQSRASVELLGFMEGQAPGWEGLLGKQSSSPRSPSKRSIQDVGPDLSPDSTIGNTSAALHTMFSIGSDGAGSHSPGRTRSYVKVPSVSGHHAQAGAGNGHLHTPSRFFKAQRTAVGGADAPQPQGLAAQQQQGFTMAQADMGAAGLPTMNLPQLQLRAHPLSSPYITPVNSPMHHVSPSSPFITPSSSPLHPSSAARSLQPLCLNKADIQQQQLHLQCMDLSATSPMAALTLMSPAASTPPPHPGARRNGSSSGDSSTGALSRPDAMRASGVNTGNNESMTMAARHFGGPFGFPQAQQPAQHAPSTQGASNLQQALHDAWGGGRSQSLLQQQQQQQQHVLQQHLSAPVAGGSQPRSNSMRVLRLDAPPTISGLGAATWQQQQQVQQQQLLQQQQQLQQQCSDPALRLSTGQLSTSLNASSNCSSDSLQQHQMQMRRLLGASPIVRTLSGSPTTNKLQLPAPGMGKAPGQGQLQLQGQSPLGGQVFGANNGMNPGIMGYQAIDRCNSVNSPMVTSNASAVSTLLAGGQAPATFEPASATVSTAGCGVMDSPPGPVAPHLQLSPAASPGMGHSSGSGSMPLGGEDGGQQQQLQQQDPDAVNLDLLLPFLDMDMMSGPTLADVGLDSEAVPLNKMVSGLEDIMQDVDMDLGLDMADEFLLAAVPTNGRPSWQ